MSLIDYAGVEPRLAVGQELWLQRKVRQTSGDSDDARIYMYNMSMGVLPLR